MIRLALLLSLPLLPGASAWSFAIEGGADDVSLTDSPLVAGNLRAVATGATFGAPHVERATFGRNATVDYCPDDTQGDQRAPNPAVTDPRVACNGERLTLAGIYVFAGGLVIVSSTDAEVILQTPSGAAALGGPNLTLNKVALPPSVYAGGPIQIDSDGDAYTVRPLGGNASIEVRGNEGFRRYNGTGYTLRVTGATGVHLESHGAFLGGATATVAVGRSPISTAERDLRVDELFQLLRGVQPPERADRRADVAEAFGPFQIVPALLNGAIAARANVTFNGEAQQGVFFLRVSDLAMELTQGRWSGVGNATYVVQDDVLAPRPGLGARLPLVAPIVLAGLALLGRLLTPRAAPRRPMRYAANAARLVGLLVLVLVAAAFLKTLLGFSPIFDMPSLALRSRVQLGLLTTGMALVSYVGVGLPVDSLARTALSHRKKPDAVLMPALIGLGAALLFLLIASATLLAFVARYVRL